MKCSTIVVVLASLLAAEAFSPGMFAEKLQRESERIVSVDRIQVTTNGGVTHFGDPISFLSQRLTRP